jgi:hypothetical protein
MMLHALRATNPGRVHPHSARWRMTPAQRVPKALSISILYSKLSIIGLYLIVAISLYMIGAICLYMYSIKSL